ncbi:primosomal protein N' (replication factor Y) - superfamily II helicase [Celeribacter neptunius]|uniref:RNA polymerase I-specific transcription initiation factor Rrn7 n=1 Tax=Celeribacter neptunius TaxID=588602 RepID=A0A1I3WI88_9RHOB|nr:primosomal protein N' (replication factor Y) - superfamily II helicase [Celeribacter neptunius]SFK06557.1 hypothetical protein SAMN04487991_3737 [Celeribacter neptunius]
MAPNEKNSALSDDHRFPCTACGADMRFDPERGDLVCTHCGAHETIETGGAMPPREMDFDAARAPGHLHHGDLFQLALEGAPETAPVTEEVRTTTCPNCGARLTLDDTVHATECPYCATPVVTDTGAHRQIKPQGVLPFAMSEERAHQAMNDWLGQLWFAPNALKQYARKGRKLNGIYMPYWTFDAQTETEYSGERGTDYYTTVQVNGKTQRRRRTKWRRVRGQVARFFDDVLVVASSALPVKYVSGLAPWDLAALEPYIPDYLAGYRAESYTVSLDGGFSHARDQMERVITRDIKFDIGGDRQRIHQMTPRYGDITYKHILLPVWTAAYKFRGKSYRFVVNGRTGQVQGERPYSAVKIAFAVILGLIVAAVVGYFVAMNQQGY